MNSCKAIIHLILIALVTAGGLSVSGQTTHVVKRDVSQTKLVEKRHARETKASAKDSKDENDAAAEAEQPVERTIAAEVNVAVKVCVASGSITVRGWDRQEVRARSTDVAELELQHEGTPAKKIQLLIADKAEGPKRTTTCLSFSDVDLDVPRGATVQLQTRDGDIKIADVATAYVNTQNGDVTIERASVAVDAGTIGGLISLKDSKGGVNLHSVGGNIDALNVRPIEAGDIFDASSVGGDITLEQVGHAKLNARSLNGSVTMTGPLAREGHYGFRTISGDVTLALPADSSFRLNAKFSQHSDLITDFPLRLLNYSTAPWSPAAKGPTPAPAVGPRPVPLPGNPAPAPAPSESIKPAPAETAAGASAPELPDEPAKAAKMKGPKVVRMAEGFASRHIEGTCGSGDAMIDVGSFSGTIHLKKL